MTPKARRVTMVFSALLAVLLGGALLLLSPMAMGALAKAVPGLDWAVLSAVGQAYGAITALLTALSLAGLVVSILVHARSVRVASEQTWRITQVELAKISLEDRSSCRRKASPGTGRMTTCR
ncbi:DUF6082 family protein [Nonomuraea insulae]|uniref:DUF6082 family protein n=1 Tax=Nonomuraea insulae TaxID=1616787 RepID=A0ABW1DB77_9ACTN